MKCTFTWWTNQNILKPAVKVLALAKRVGTKENSKTETRTCNMHANSCFCLLRTSRGNDRHCLPACLYVVRLLLAFEPFVVYLSLCAIVHAISSGTVASKERIDGIRSAPRVTRGFVRTKRKRNWITYIPLPRNSFSILYWIFKNFACCF